MRVVAEMVEEARAADVKAAVEKAAAAARVAIAAMRQAGASESKYVHHKRPTSTFHCIAKGMSRKRAAFYCCFHRNIVALHSMHYCHPHQNAPRISGA